MTLDTTWTFERAATAQKQHTTGFDYLRVGLALAVLAVHCLFIGNLKGWEWTWTSPFRPLELAILPAFFALSGYLVTGSLFRNTIPQFAALRIARIFPALAVEVTFCAMILGPMATTLGYREYFSSGEFFRYLLNVIGDIHYTLPGVFAGRLLNLQLWTIPFELECYVTLIVLMVLGLVSRQRLLLILASVAVAGMAIYDVFGSVYLVNWNVPGRMLVIAFVCGCLAYLYRDRIPHSAPLFFLALAAAYGLLLFPNLVFLSAVPLTYATIYIGLLRLPPIPFGDVSYGVYLFHFPIARTIHEASGRRIGWVPLLVLTTISSGIFATLSWRLVEKPVLDRKRALLRMVDRVTARFHWTQRP